MKKRLMNGLLAVLVPLGGYAGSGLGGYSGSGSRQSPVVHSLMNGYGPALEDDQHNTGPREARSDEALTLKTHRAVSELVVLDAAVPDKHLFYRQMKPGVDVLELNGREDGLEQLLSALSGYTELAALHIVSHGDEGALHLGSSVVDAAALERDDRLLRRLHQSMGANADVLLYGCDVAAGDGGERLLELIAGDGRLDVAASDDRTGQAGQGGDWDLEIQRGDITAASFSSSALKDFSSVLAPEQYIPADFCTVGCANSSPSHTSSDGDFEFAGSADVHAYDFWLRTAGFYLDSSTDGQASGYLEFEAVGAGLASFELTELKFATYGNTSCSSANVTGYLAGGGTVSDPFTLSSSGSVALSSLVGQQITRFRVNASSCDNVFFALGVVDFTVDNKQPTADSDGDLTAAAGVTEPVGLPSTAASAAGAVNVFDFTLSDGGGGDGLPLDVNEVVVNVSGTSTDAERGQVTWRLNGNDASNVTGSYNAGSDTITFSGLSISVADGASETYTVNAYYNDNTNLTEDHTFVLGIDGDTDLTVGASGTQMGPTTAVTNASGGTVDIVATELAFTTQPAGSVSGSALTSQPVVAARDAYGNTDVDFAETITLTESSAGSLSGDIDIASVAGVATFTDLAYTATADQESFTLTANDEDGAGTNLPSVDAGPVVSDVVATGLVFATQPAPTSIESDTQTAFTTAPVVSAIDGNGVLDTGYGTNIVLAVTDPDDGFVDGTVSSLSGTGDADGDPTTVTLAPGAGTATFSGLQIDYSNASTTDTIALRAASGGLTPVNSVPITSSDRPTVTDANVSIAGASGTGGAFIIGDTVTATWNNTAGGDDNQGITSVTVDFSEFGGGSAVAASNSLETWTATHTITPGSIDATGRNVSVTATNAAGSTTTADSTGASVDNEAPTVSDPAISLSGATGDDGSFVLGDVVTVSWDDTVAGNNNADAISEVSIDFSAFGGGAAVVASISGGVWTASYTVDSSSTAGNGLNASVTATDNAGNATTASDTSDASVDYEAPTGHSVSFVEAAINADQASNASFAFAGAEPGADYSYTVSSSGGGTNATGMGTVATAEEVIEGLDLTALEDGSLVLSVILTDSAGNAAPAVTHTATLDTTVPEPTISSATADPTNAPFQADIDFGEAVNGFVVGDISTTNASLSDFSDEGNGLFSVTVTPTSEGVVTLDIAAGVAQDAAGNDNVASGAFELSYDATSPSLVGSSPADGATDVPSNTDLVFSFDEAVVAGAGAVELRQAADDSLVASIDITSGQVGIDGSEVTVDLAGSLTGNETYYVNIDPGALEDAAGNAFAGIGGTSSLDFTVGYPVPSAGDDDAEVDEEGTVTIPVVANDEFGTDGAASAAVVVVVGPDHGSASVDDNGTPNDPQDDRIDYAPDPDYFGSDAFEYRIEDADGDVDVAQVTVTVAPVNDAPSIEIGGDRSAVSGQDELIESGFAGEFDPGPNEADQSIDEFVVGNDNNDLFSVQPAIDQNGTLSFTPNAENRQGSAEVTVQVRDDGGTANGGEDLSVARSFTITIGTSADVSIQVSGESDGEAGSTATYTVTVSNDGPSAAEGVVVSVDRPEGMFFESAGPPCSAGFPCEIGAAMGASTQSRGGSPSGAIEAGESVSFGATFRLDRRMLVGDEVRWSVTSDSSDPDSSDNERGVGFDLAPLVVPLLGLPGLILMALTILLLGLGRAPSGSAGVRRG